MEAAVDILALEKYVKAGRISPQIPSGTLEKLLDDEVYVVTSVLKTKKIVVSAQGDSGIGVNVDVPIIQQAVGGSVRVNTTGARESRVAFEGAVPVAFAFQAVQLVFDDSGEFLTTEQLAAGDAAARALPPAGGPGRNQTRGPVFLEARGAFVRVAQEGVVVTEKRLTVILYGCDRNLWRGGPLKIRVFDVFASGGPRPLLQGETKEATLELRLQLPFDAGQVYGLTFSAPDHRPAWQLVRRVDFIRAPERVEGDDLVLRLMLVPDSPGTTDLPQGLERLQQIASPFAAPTGGIDAGTFRALDVAARMAFLNIEAKLRETFLDGAPLLTFVRGVRHVAVDRAFLFVDAGLKARMPRAGDFAAAPGHGALKRLDLPAHPDSWKHTRFAEGNVQLSFSRDAMSLPGGDRLLMVHSADVDIDLGRGLAHVREWLENNVCQPGHKTNQALVYGLLYAQGILPRYTLDPASATTLREAPRLRAMRAPSKGRSTRRRPARRSSAARVRKKEST